MDPELAAAVNMVMAQTAVPRDAFPNVMIVAALRKSHDNDFVTPMQGKYLADIESAELADEYPGGRT